MQKQITKAQPTAQEAYITRQQNIIALAAQLGALVQAHQTSNVDWAHVGDLGQIEVKLQEAIEFLGGN